MKSTIDRLIINSPYEEPAHYWSYDRETRFFNLKEGRRPAGYVIASESSKAFDDPGKFIEIPLVNKIRPRIKAWRESGYPGVTGITKRLLEHWRNPEEREYRRFFFCRSQKRKALTSAGQKAMKPMSVKCWARWLTRTASLSSTMRRIMHGAYLWNQRSKD